MKKTLLATALLAGFVSAASAQSSVTLYGVVDAALSYTNYSYSNSTTGSVGTSQFGARNGQQSGSRWGMKGVEDLGGGSAAIFQLESGIVPGNGTQSDSARLFNRQSWFGVQNAAFGAVKFGRQNSVSYDYMGLKTDPFEIASALVGSTTAFTWNSNRYDNLLSYETPVMSGFQAKVGYSFAAGNASYYQTTTAAGAVAYTAGSAAAAYNFNTQNNLTGFTAGAKYSNGPLYLVATYEQLNPNQNIVGGLNNVNGFIVGGTYDFGVAKVYADYGRQYNGLLAGGNQQMQGITTTDITDASSATTGNVVFAPGVAVNAYLVGLSAPVGPNGTLLASFQAANPNSAFSQNAVYVSQANQSTYSLGYSYNFSKRTNLYAFGSYTSNYAMVSGLNATQVMVGLRHTF